MPFSVTVHLLEPSYQASTLDRGRAEWPPHPARIFCGLVSVADPQDPVQDAALRWLEQQTPPKVRVPAMTAEADTARTAWVPINASTSKPGHAVLPGRTNGGRPKSWPQRTLAQPEVEFIWEAEPPVGVRAVLEVLAKAVPYIGRASGHAMVHAAVTSATGDTDEEWQVWEPLADDVVLAAGVETLRVPYPGYLERLRAAYGQGQPAWQQARSHRYAVTGRPDPLNEEAVPGPFSDLIAFAFPTGMALDPRLTMAVTGSLRVKLLELLEQAGHDVDPMVAVHGHKTPDFTGRTCAYLGLPFVGHEHADGQLRGVGVALPHDLDPAHRRAVLAVLLRAGGGLRKLSVPTRERPVPLAYVGAAAPDVKPLQSVRPETWTRRSRGWATALPMALDHFPKRNGREIEVSVTKSCRMAGLPEPAHIQVMRRGALLPGARDLPPSALRRKDGERPLPGRHVRLYFDQPLAGPVVLGSKKNFGLGLCLPTDPTAGETW